MNNLTMGIDGGGSTLRVVIADADLNVLAQAARGTANPSAIGWDAAAALIHEAMREALAQVDQPIAAVGIGVAGAAASRAGDWLRATVGTVLPGIPVAASSDYEIALVGAMGALEGVLLLAGTGSVAYGVNPAGLNAQVGGWGYLLGDEGGGYWIGLQALRAVVRWADAGQPESAVLPVRALQALELAHPQALITWMYRAPPPLRETAALAALVLELAAQREAEAAAIVDAGAEILCDMVALVRRRLSMPDAAVAFAGGLLSTDNPLSSAVCQHLGLASIPQARYTPVIGAALLAQMSVGK
jgi:N-acetylglucosamine kinase-like BadF-type ATPase